MVESKVAYTVEVSVDSGQRAVLWVKAYAVPSPTSATGLEFNLVMTSTDDSGIQAPEVGAFSFTEELRLCGEAAAVVSGMPENAEQAIRALLHDVYGSTASLQIKQFS